MADLLAWEKRKHVQIGIGFLDGATATTAACKLKHEAMYKDTSWGLILISEPAALNKPELQVLGRALSLS